MIVFLSYRRDDSGGWALALADALRRKFGRGRIFVDVDKIRNFENFEANIFASIDRSDVFVPVIGKRWLELSDEAGQRRLDDPGDYVRREIAHALERGVRIIPVLVEHAAMPTTEQLPQELRALAQPLVVELTPEGWNEDLADFLLQIDAGARFWRRRVIVVGIAGFAAGFLSGSLAPMLSALRVWPFSRDPGTSYFNYGYGSYGYRGAIGGHLL